MSSFISKVELKYQLEKMGIHIIKENYVRKSDVTRIFANTNLRINLDDINHKYPVVKKIDDLSVSDNVPNIGSIESSLDKYFVLKGIREIPFSEFTDVKSAFYAANDWERSKNLASEIEENKYIDPLIVVIDNQGPYILEGSHRWVALSFLKVKSLPALVVIDLDKIDLMDNSVRITADYKLNKMLPPHPLFHATPAAVQILNQGEGICSGKGSRWAKGNNASISLTRDVTWLLDGKFGTAILVLDRDEIKTRYKVEPLDALGYMSGYKFRKGEAEERVYTKNIPINFIKAMITLVKPIKNEYTYPKYGWPQNVKYIYYDRDTKQAVELS